MRVFICLFLLVHLFVSVSATIIDESLKEEFPDAEYIIDDDFELVISNSVELSEYGKNILFKDVCVVDDGFVIVGGAVRIGDYYGGMDALVIKYKDEQVEWFKIFGGSNSDIFNTIYCDQGIIVGGESYSIDHDLIGNDSTNFKIGIFASLDLEGGLNWFNSHKERFDFTITSADYTDEVIFSGYLNDLTSDEIFIFSVDEYGNITKLKIFSYSGNDYVHDLLVDESIILVGSTNSSEFNVLGQRGLVLELDANWEIINSYTDKSSSLSIYSNIDKLDQIYISGSINKHEKQEFSNSEGLLGTYDGEFVSKENDLSIVTGISRTSLGDIVFGGTIIKDKYLPNTSLDYEFESNGVVLDIIESDGLKIIYTDTTRVNKGVIISLDFLEIIGDELYFNNEPFVTSRIFIDDSYNTGIYGTYKSCEYVTFDGYEYYSDLVIQSIPFYTNLERSIYYESLSIYFNGRGTLNELPIESGYVLSESGLYELMIYGANKESRLVEFELKIRGRVESDFYSYESELVELEYKEIVKKENDYRLYGIGVAILAVSLFILYRYKKDI